MLSRIAPRLSALFSRPQETSPVQDQMRSDWDDRARKDALYYIVTDAADSEEHFAASGDRSVADILEDVEPPVPSRATVLEIGCGIGRMLRPLAGRFGTVYGVDVSAEMIERARRRLGDLENVQVWLTDGFSLQPIQSGTVDLAISYLVFQHIPEAAVVENNIRETFRVLKPGGVFKFQVAGRPETEEAAVVERARTKDTWCGVNYTDAEIRRTVKRAGFRIRKTFSHAPPDSCIFLWVVAERPR